MLTESPNLPKGDSGRGAEADHPAGSEAEKQALEFEP
jgi:hypothetical protein